MGLYNQTDGSKNISVVDGNTRTGIQAPDGSYYVVVSTTNVPKGVNHPCGAYNVTLAPTNNQRLYADDGSYFVSTTPFTDRGLRVTVVSGSLNPGPGTGDGTMDFSIATGDDTGLLVFLEDI